LDLKIHELKTKEFLIINPGEFDGLRFYCPDFTLPNLYFNGTRWRFTPGGIIVFPVMENEGRSREADFTFAPILKNRSRLFQRK